jgi:hypothetical protein
VVPQDNGEQGSPGGDVPDAISWGDVRIAAVIDWAGEVPDAIGLLPGTSHADWERHRGWSTTWRRDSSAASGRDFRAVAHAGGASGAGRKHLPGPSVPRPGALRG